MCTSPMLAELRRDPKTGRFRYFFCCKEGSNSMPYHANRDNCKEWSNLDKNWALALKLFNPGIDKAPYIRIPCGNCVQCRLKYSKDWSTRMLCEAATYNFENCYFLTLTYDDNNLRFGSTGNPTVCKKDIQDFMNSVRDNQLYQFKHTGVRYYGATEYGGTNGRPHCHVILFNCKVPSDGLELLFTNKFNQPLYKGLYFQKYWPFGFVTVGGLSFESCAYVARYCMKKHKGKDKSYYTDLQIEAEDSTKSNRPGIGRFWFDEHYDELYINENDCIVDSIYFPPSAFLDSKAKKLAIPSYFDDLLEAKDADVYKRVKANRLLKANNAEDMHYYMVGDGFNSDYFAASEARFKSIERKLTKFCV